jgi:DNA-binding transcriptional regulator YhcF (GntR family)
MVLQWKFNGSRPVYMQIKEQICGAILMGEFPPGARIPPVREFASQAQVNPNTMQRAMLELEREGLVVSCGTMGRFVTNDSQILETMRQAAYGNLICASAAQFKSMGMSIKQAAEMLLALEQEEENNG